MRRITTFGCWLAVAASCSAAQGANLADFVDYSLRTTAGQALLPGRLFIPPEASNPAQPRPFIVFLHGGGAAGTNNTTPVAHTPDFLLDEAKRRGAFLYVPQAAGTWSPTSVIDQVSTMIDRAVGEYNVDARRLYATGYSNGGGGTWNLLSRNPRRFAAGLAVAGVAPASGFAPANLLSTAIFAIHARDDATVSVDRSRTVISSILAAGGAAPPLYDYWSGKDFFVYNPGISFHQSLAGLFDPAATTFSTITRPSVDVLYFEGAGGGHGGPVGIYYEPITYQWMFAHALPAPEPASWGLAVVGISGLIFARRRGSRRSDLVRAHEGSCR